MLKRKLFVVTVYKIIGLPCGREMWSEVSDDAVGCEDSGRVGGASGFFVQRYSAVSDSHLGYPAQQGSAELVEGRCSH